MGQASELGRIYVKVGRPRRTLLKIVILRGSCSGVDSESNAIVGSRWDALVSSLSGFARVTNRKLKLC